MKDSIAFIESNTTGTGEAFIRVAEEAGFEVIFLTKKSEKYPFLKKKRIHPVWIDTENPAQMVAYLQKVSTLKGVMSTSESYVYYAAQVAEQLSLPHTAPEAIARCQDKYGLIAYLKQAAVPTIATTTTQADVACFPVILKPNPGTGSIGVRLCYSKEELAHHIEKLNRPFIIQEYIEGEEYSAEVIVEKGLPHMLGVTKKHLGPKPYFVEQGHDFPAQLADNLYQEVQAVIYKALKEVGFDFGPAHVEFRIRDKQVYIIEINPRLAGGMIPLLIEKATGISLLKSLLHLYTGKHAAFTPKWSKYAKIAFFLPKQEGILSAVTGIPEKQSGLIEFHLYKNVGDFVTLKGDFSDRVGYVIAKGATLKACAQQIEKATHKIALAIENKESSWGRGRLAEPLDPRVQQIFGENPLDNFDELFYLSKINRAHLKMLKASQIISSSQAQALLKGIKMLEEENFKSVRVLNDPRIGTYLAYEHRLADLVGVEIAGLIHIGRSRNDINATLQRLKTQNIYQSLYDVLWGLRSDILQIAARSLNVPMPIYSQYQAAIPGTYAYYLTGIENSLALSQKKLQSLFPFLEISPLGGASGGGTTYPTCPEIVAKELGFKKGPLHALTTVASREVELTLLSIGAILGTTLSRIAQDYHLWLTKEFAFFELPDSLCGISSAMPQKKNPYLLEKIKGKAIRISGTLHEALAIMNKVPFANSVEVGTEALVHYTESFSDLIQAIKLLSLIIQGAQPIQKNMDRSNKQGLTVATQVAETLAQTRAISFREAHQIVGKTIQKSLSEGADPLPFLLSLTPTVKEDPRYWHLPFEYGKGGGAESTAQILKGAIEALKKDR